MRGGGWKAARLGELVTSPLSLMVAQASQRLAWASHGSEKSSKWPFCPPFWAFSAFFIETTKNLTDCATTGVKQLNSANKNQNISNWSPPNEIRVWQLPLFTYIFIENVKVNKDKDINFILAILPSDQPLAKTQVVKPFKRKNVRGIRYIKQKTSKSWKVTETLKSRQKTLIVLEM